MLSRSYGRNVLVFLEEWEDSGKTAVGIDPTAGCTTLVLF